MGSEPVTIDFDKLEKIDEGFRIKETEDYVIEVHKMIFNWRLLLLLPGQNLTMERGFCYFGTGPDALIRAVAAGLAWEDPYNKDPDGFDKHAF